MTPYADSAAFVTGRLFVGLAEGVRYRRIAYIMCSLSTANQHSCTPPNFQSAMISPIVRPGFSNDGLWSIP
jgi:hypothetical protein